MDATLEFSDLLRLIDERSTAFRAVVAGASSLEVAVPSCPGWTLFDLAEHLGVGRRNWAATVAEGPASAKAVVEGSAPREREALLAWLVESTESLLSALRAAGPNSGSWVWWGQSQSPETTGAVARHQLQEVAVHTYDAYLTVGDPQPLPVEIALDGVEEFQFTCCATTVAWPHEPAVVDYHATEGRSWRLRLSGEGAQVSRLSEAEAGVADASAQGTASDLVLWFYARVSADTLKLEGDRVILDQLVDWDPSV